MNEKASAEEEANLVIAEIVEQYYEEKYVNHKEDVGETDEYIKTQLTGGKKTQSGYDVKYNEETGKIEVSENDQTIFSGTMANGKVEWTKENTGDNSGGNETNPPPEIPEGLVVGSTVSYNPSGTYNWQAEYCSSRNTPGIGDVVLNSAEGQKFNVSNWRILSIDEKTGKVKMVPNEPTIGIVSLDGAQGYNNGVKLLNDACSNLYSDENKGITARSINIEDIEKVMDEEKMNEAKANYSNKNSQYKHLNADNQVSTPYVQGLNNYPFIYAKEKLATIDGTKKQTGFGISEQSEFIGRSDIENGKKATIGYLYPDSNIQPYQTYYYMDDSEFLSALGSTYASILLPKGINTCYWVASRCVDAFSDYCNFNMRNVRSGLNYYNMFYTSGGLNGNEFALFPVVSLNSNLITGDVTNGFFVQ